MMNKEILDLTEYHDEEIPLDLYEQLENKIIIGKNIYFSLYENLPEGIIFNNIGHVFLRNLIKNV